MKVIVVGGDGFCGWPLSLRLSRLDHDVCIVDNLSRRKIDVELATSSLAPIADIETRLRTWAGRGEKVIRFENINVAEEYHKLKLLIAEFAPNAIIHLGEQRAAPYSMKNENTKRYTVSNNLNGTHNLLCAIVEVNRDINFIHLGTMGVYGYGAVPDTVIPEGYISVKMGGGGAAEKSVDILHPAYPGSIYHLTKTQDALFFQFYAKNYGLKITDLHQGIIWGHATAETRLHADLTNRFDYDSDYGTVLNRFIVQAAHGIPMTVYGTGGQTRAFIHIENSMDCVVLALTNPPKRGDRVKIFNQIAETKSLCWLAERIRAIYPDARVQYLDNPRNELSANDLVVANNQFLDLGLKPILIDDQRICEIYSFVKDHKINHNKVMPTSFWK
jgi:UDP-sulfoquinovose synthase